MDKEQPKVLFLSLKTFSLTGGIEKVNRAFSKVLDDLQKLGKIKTYTSISMYDDKPNLKYVNPNNFEGFNGNRVGFGISALQKGIKADIIALSHINLLVFAKIIKTIYKKKG